MADLAVLSCPESNTAGHQDIQLRNTVGTQKRHQVFSHKFKNLNSIELVGTSLFFLISFSLLLQTTFLLQRKKTLLLSVDICNISMLLEEFMILKKNMKCGASYRLSQLIQESHSAAFLK